MGSFAKPADQPRLVETTSPPEIFVTGALLPEVHNDHMRVTYYVERHAEAGNPDSEIVREVNLHVCMSKETFSAIMRLYGGLQRDTRADIPLQIGLRAN